MRVCYYVRMCLTVKDSVVMELMWNAKVLVACVCVTDCV